MFLKRCRLSGEGRLERKDCLQGSNAYGTNLISSTTHAKLEDWHLFVGDGRIFKKVNSRNVT